MESSKNCNERQITARLLWPILGMATVIALVLSLVKPWNGRPGTSAASRFSQPRKSEVGNEIDAAVASSNKEAVGRGTSRAVSQPLQPASGLGTNLQEKEVEARAAELMQLAMNDDTASLETILKELRNPNRALRDAALQAAIQYGSRDAIPSLNEAAQRTDDENERNQLLSAIEFLKLPSLTEVMLKDRSQDPSAQSVSSH